MKKLENIIFYIAIIVSGYTLFKIYISNKNLPEGVCPVNNYRGYIYLSVALAGAYLIMSLINKYKYKES